MVALYASASVSAFRNVVGPSSPTRLAPISSTDTRRPVASSPAGLGSLLAPSSFLSLLIAPPAPDEAIATYEVVSGVCTNVPKTTFDLGDTVCARATSAPVGFRQFNWVGTKGFVRQTADVTADPDTNLFTLPLSNTSVIDGASVDNRGIWAVSLNTIDHSTRSIAYFNVKDPDNAAADLIVYNFSTTGDPIEPGTNTGFFLWLSNAGPDAAANVHLTMAVPPSMTFDTASTSSAFACAESAGVVDCSVASWASGAVATITLNFIVSGAAPNGVTSSTADISSDTNDPRPASNTSEASVEIRSAGSPPATCALGCPSDIVVTATGPSGAVVNFAGSVEVSGDCGTIAYSPASGSTFPIGTNSVMVTSGGGSGGSCSFTVTVIDPTVSPAPTITCPLPDLTAAAASGQGSATVAVTPPSATGTGVAVSGTRSDSQIRNDDGTFVEDLSDPYPVGTTIITWTATDSNQRTASCTQRVIVTSADFPTIQCPLAGITLNAGGSCAATGVITPPTYGGAGAILTSRRGDDLALTAPFPAGQTIITWTATNALGVASCTQIVTVTNTGNASSPPVLTVPPDVNVTTTSCSALLDDELGVATAVDVCASSVNIARTGVPTVSCPIPGDPGRMCESFVFPVGTTAVTYTATNSAGLTAIGVQHVTVHGATPPAFTFVPANVTVSTGAGATSCGSFVGDATLGTATVFDNCDNTVIRTGVPAGNNFPVGVTTITYTAKADTSVTATQLVTVVDNTIPVVTAPGPVTLYTGAGATSCGVTVSNLDATLGVGSATDNCSGVGAVTRSGVPAGNTFPLGNTTVTYSATDAHGNSASATQVVTVVDNTPPVISCPANVTVYLPLNSTATSVAVNYPAATATDNCAGPITFGYSIASGSVFPMGPTPITVTATDAHSNSSSCTFTVTVLYDFTGFFSPVGNLPTLNAVNAGRAIPVKFSLSGNKGLNIFAANNPYSVSFNCSTNDPGVDVIETLTAGGSSLSFSGDQYNYVWKTENSWAGTCRRLVLTLNDGSVHEALFKFK